MSISKFLGLSRPDPEAAAKETETVRRIVRELEALPGDRARFIASFAYILNRVARADLDVSEAETRRMEEIVGKLGGLEESHAILAVQIARSQGTLLGGTEDYLVTREFKRLATPDEREHLLYCLFEVCAADDSISVEEEELVRQIATELEFSHGEYIQARSVYSSKRAILQNMPGGKTRPE